MTEIVSAQERWGFALLPFYWYGKWWWGFYRYTDVRITMKGSTMSYSITVSGTKKDAIKAAKKQCYLNVGNGYMTEEQMWMVETIIDAAPGEIVSGYISGHNNDGGGGTMSVSITASNPVPEAPAAEDQKAE